MKLAIIIPAYNEEQTIGEVIRQIPKPGEFSLPQNLPQITTIRIFVIDNGSTDKTALKAQIFASQAGHKLEIVKLNQPCLAHAFSTGINEAIAWDADIILNLDADGQYDPSEIPRIIRPILEGRADFVIGDRQVKKLAHMPAAKKYGNLIGSWFIRRLTGLANKPELETKPDQIPPSQSAKAINIHPQTIDASSGFRAFTHTAAAKFQIHSNHTYTHENLIQAYYLGLRIVQIPIIFTARPEHAKSSRLITSVPLHIAKSLGNIAKAWWRYRMKPCLVRISSSMARLLVVGLIAVYL
ncbi:glycosyltransferase family 2 protein [Candidatus Gracilibacteria bacterium]|nr:glycosyltransferase family 2 protein [Candidatus Gracilibacteria bacterium]